MYEKIGLEKVCNDCHRTFEGRWNSKYCPECRVNNREMHYQNYLQKNRERHRSAPKHICEICGELATIMVRGIHICTNPNCHTLARLSRSSDDLRIINERQKTLVNLRGKSLTTAEAYKLFNCRPACQTLFSNPFFDNDPMLKTECIEKYKEIKRILYSINPNMSKSIAAAALALYICSNLTLEKIRGIYNISTVAVRDLCRLCYHSSPAEVRTGHYKGRKRR
jgi:hypothetical protein